MNSDIAQIYIYQEMMKLQKEGTYPFKKYFFLSEEQRKGKFSIGVLVDRDLPIYDKQLEKLRAEAKAEGKEEGT